MIDFKGTINFAQTAAVSLAGTALTVVDATVFDGADALPTKPLRLSVIRNNELVDIVIALSRSGNVITLQSTGDIEPDDNIRATITSEAIEDIHDNIDELDSSRLINTNNLSDIEDRLEAKENLGITYTEPVAPEEGDIWFDDTSSLSESILDLLEDNASDARTSLGLIIGTNVQAYDADLSAIATLSDPNADRILFWDDSAGAYTYLSPGTNLSITGTTINAAGGSVAIGDTIGSGVAGRILYLGASGVLAQSANFTYDGNSFSSTTSVGYANTHVGQHRFNGNYSGFSTVEIDNYSYTAPAAIPLVITGGVGQSQPLVVMQQMSSTPTKRRAGYLDASLPVTTDASWTGRITLEAGDYTSSNLGRREGVRVESDATQALVGFYGHAAVPQGAAIADATDATSVITQLNALLAYLRSRGDIAT